jgi:8-oxo-dGTP pyrophosphatase MutT (NUDIX family)
MGATRIQRSAGGVIYQVREGEMWVALISTQEGTVWGLPKGLIEKSEKALDAALREVREEAGLHGQSEADLGHIEYWYRDAQSRVLYHKFVHYYLLRCEGGDVADHGWEVDEARWFTIDEAMETISYENERGVLLKARESWEATKAEAE